MRVVNIIRKCDDATYSHSGCAFSIEPNNNGSFIVVRSIADQDGCTVGDICAMYNSKFYDVGVCN